MLDVSWWKNAEESEFGPWCMDWNILFKNIASVMDFTEISTKLPNNGNLSFNRNYSDRRYTTAGEFDTLPLQK